MIKFLFTYILLSFAVFANAQSYYTVSGKITDAVTGAPLQGASVFAQNTTIGTATDADGNYKIYLPNGGYDLVVTFTGYNTDSKRVSANDEDNKNVSFSLKQKEREMEDVTVTASSEVKDGWVKYGDFFLENFIGKTINSEKCSLKNPEVLKFFYSKRKNRLKITANEPLVIENESLGYIIKYALDSFAYEYNSEISVYAGFPLFEEMKPNSNDQFMEWASKRQQAYQGSILHFMRSLYQQQLKEQGFEIQFLINNNGVETALKLKDPYIAIQYASDDSLQTVTINPTQKNVGVLYKQEKPAERYISLNPDEPKDFQFSILRFLPTDPIVIEQNGYYYEQNDVSISAYWTWDKIADLLPYDYVPVKF